MAIQNGPSRAGGATEADIGYTEHRSDIANRAPRQARQDRLVDFLLINRAALSRLRDILSRWLPGGRIERHEYVVRNPTRHDQRLGSFKVNLATGRWADFATADKGGDPISLAAYLAGCGQLEAARRLATMLGIGARNGR
jgi:hypothetical protein